MSKITVAIPSQDGVKLNVITPSLSVWVTLKQSAGGVVAFSRKDAPATHVPISSSQRTSREFRGRSPSCLNSRSDVEASGKHASSRAKTHPTAAPEIQKERILIGLSTV